MKKTTLHMTIIAVMTFFFISCSSSDVARVTINLGIPSQAKTYAPSLFDRIVALISLSSNAQADQPSGQLSVDRITITATSGGSEVASVFFSNTDPEWVTGAATLEIPAGGPYTFIVVGQYFNGQTVNRTYGGIETLESISGGQEMMLSINMGLLPVYNSDFYLSTSGSNPLLLDLFTQSTNIEGYIVYRAQGTWSAGINDWITGSFSKIVTFDAAPLSTTVTYNDPEGISDDCTQTEGDPASVYKIVPFNSFGEGDTVEHVAIGNGGC
ncbi:MAG: hypothetical protein EPN93_04665 [Spirochaetes bacterium]|nr:MAG: hypothetical protein EPN93_04665 [Spirochaetota bacterium]